MELFQIHALKEGKIAETPFPDVPYYVLASDGLFLRKNTALGVVTLKQDDFPKHLAKADMKVGSLKYTAPRMPKYIIERAWGFFKKTWEERHAEAEVLILYNEARKRYRLFAPHQETSMAAVNSIYDPADIPANYIVFGSIHSHCDFGAFHSGTDTADASDFNGLHITMGHVDDPAELEFAVMVMINGVQWNFDINEVVEIGEDAELVPRRTPPLWDTMFGTREEIAKRNFKTLTVLDLKDWADAGFKKFTSKTHTRSVIPSSNQGPKVYSSYNGDDDWNNPWFGYPYSNPYDDSKKNQAANYNKRYSFETKGYVDVNWIGKNGELKDQHVEEAFDLRLQEMFEVLLNRGFWLKWDIEELSTEERANLKVIKDVNPNALLPGPFSVMSDDDDDANTIIGGTLL